MNNNPNVHAINMLKTLSNISSAVLALNAVRKNEFGSNDALLYSLTDLSTWAIERLRRRSKRIQVYGTPELGNEETEQSPPTFETLSQVAEKLNQFLNKAKCNGSNSGNCENGAGSALIKISKDYKTSNPFDLVLTPCSQLSKKIIRSIIIDQPTIKTIQNLSNNQDQEIFNILKPILEEAKVKSIYEAERNIISLYIDEIIKVNGERSYLKICDANNLIPSPLPELNKTFLESFATSINKSFSDNNCKNIKVSYSGNKERCNPLSLSCGQFFKYSLSITINGSKINTAEKNDSDFFYIPVNEMKEIQKKILNKEDPPLKNYYIKTLIELYNYPTLKYDNYEYRLKIEFINNKLCCLLSPLERCKNILEFDLGQCSKSNPSTLPTIKICGSCKK